KASGEELASFRQEELPNVWTLKQRLARTFKISRFRQQLLHGTICLTDASKLDELVDVQLVLLDSHGTSMPDKRAIMAAACQGDVSALEALLQRRLDPDIVAVYYREEDEDEDFECSVLLETPLDKSVDGGHVGCTRLLLEACAGTVTFSEMTPLPLVRACRRGNTEMVKLLLEFAADMDGVDFTNGAGRSLQCIMSKPLRSTSRFGYVNQNMLVEARARIDRAARNFEEGTPLHAAASSGHLEVVQLLLERRADINKGTDDYKGGTPLRAASGRGHLEVVELLLNARADSSKGTCPQSSGVSFQHATQSPCVDEETRRRMADMFRDDLGWIKDGTPLQ
ncbi:ANKHD1, partial [Symbiodinium pilosum]